MFLSGSVCGGWCYYFFPFLPSFNCKTDFAFNDVTTFLPVRAFLFFCSLGFLSVFGIIGSGSGCIAVKVCPHNGHWQYRISPCVLVTLALFGFRFNPAQTGQYAPSLGQYRAGRVDSCIIICTSWILIVCLSLLVLSCSWLSRNSRGHVQCQ